MFPLPGELAGLAVRPSRELAALARETLSRGRVAPPPVAAFTNRSSYRASAPESLVGATCGLAGGCGNLSRQLYCRAIWNATIDRGSSSDGVPPAR
jgi:hypothetical protein